MPAKKAGKKNKTIRAPKQSEAPRLPKKQAAEAPAPYAPEKQEVKITAAKGRPMLTWVGKRPLRQVTAFPAQLVERFSPLPQGEGTGSEGLLFHGDNKEVLANLLASGYRGNVNLIYIDPPFDSGADYVRKVQLRGVAGAAKLDGEEYTLGEQIQYTDIWANDNYLQFMYERLLLLKELLAEDGSIYLHCDWHKVHFLRSVADEVFGEGSLLSEIVWKRTTAKSNVTRKFPSIHDTILLYVKDKDSFCWNQQYIEYSQEHIEQFYCFAESPDGKVIKLESGQEPPHGWRRFGSDNIVNPGYRPNLAYVYKGYLPPQNGYKFKKEVMERLDAENRLIFPLSQDGRIRLKKYLDEMPGKLAQDIWDEEDVAQISPSERYEYPTQKPEGILARMIRTSSNPGDLILDCFIGSGTTAAVAQRLGRRWIGCDINKGAIQTTSKRLQTIILEQIEAEKKRAQQPVLPHPDPLPEGEVRPAQLAFSTYRVNDYDLHIQHNEAVNLACEHIGIKRTKSDLFFDGELGKRLVKIIPFNHPLTPLDLEEIKNELAARPDEERDIVVVCLGKELAVDAWLEEWNRYRKQRDFQNKIEIIELRTDPKYGKFFVHQSAAAKVDIKRDNGQIKIKIRDFISPTIIERLKEQAGILAPHIDDWRAMVDSVAIDPAYDGAVFSIALSDVPEKKTDLVAGEYEIPAPNGNTAVAVKIVDMLGEEVLFTKEV